MPVLRGGGPRRSRRPEDGELVGDLQPLRAEAEQGAWPTAGRPGRTSAACRDEHVAADEHALEVRRRDVVTERGAVDVAELRDGELRRRERERDVRVRELRAQPVAARSDECRVVESRRREAIDAMPGSVRGDCGTNVARDETEVGRRELPLVRDAIRIAERLELLEMCNVADVDLRFELPTDRFLERLAGL